MSQRLGRWILKYCMSRYNGGKSIDIDFGLGLEGSSTYFSLCQFRCLNMVISSERLQDFLSQHPAVAGISIGLVQNYQVSGHSTGLAKVSTNESLDPSHYLQCASLSKTVATAFAIEYFRHRRIDFLTTRVNDILDSAGAEWRIRVDPSSKLPQSAADSITINMLVNHTALGMHYVFGIPLTEEYPGPLGFITANPVAAKYKYNPLLLEREPGTKFSYSGGGYVVLEYLIETLERRPITEVTRPFLDTVGLQEFTFVQMDMPLRAKIAHGYITPDNEVEYLAFPAFAAGALCTPRALAQFLSNLAAAYRCPVGVSGISHETAQLMLGDATSVDLGSLDFMGAKMGLGVFVATAGANKIMLHQAANDGYRGVYMLCFDGPDAGKGFVTLCNGDNPAVLLISALCRYLLGPDVLNISGIDFSKYKDDLNVNLEGVKQESIVNKGFKDLVLFAFQSRPQPHSRL